MVQDETFAMDDNADPDPGPSISVLSASPVPQRKRDTQKKEWVLEARGNVQSVPYASWDLVKLSLPPGKSPLLNDYYYDDSLGQGSTIYIFDSGADPSSKVGCDLTLIETRLADYTRITNRILAPNVGSFLTTDV